MEDLVWQFNKQDQSTHRASKASQPEDPSSSPGTRMMGAEKQLLVFIL